MYGLNMYLNPRIHGSIPTECKNFTREGVEKIVRWHGPHEVVGPGLLQIYFYKYMRNRGKKIKEKNTIEN
jgi:hypothetical protein